MVFHPSHRPLEIATRFPQFHSPDDDDISPTNKKHKGTLLSSYRGGHFYWALTNSAKNVAPRPWLAYTVRARMAKTGKSWPSLSLTDVMGSAEAARNDSGGRDSSQPESRGERNPCLAVIIPYRDRAAHLDLLLPAITAFLEDRAINHTVLIVEQNGSRPFNRGKLLNVGFRLTEGDSTYVCFHDVDLMPEGSECDYSPVPCPTQLAVYPPPPPINSPGRIPGAASRCFRDRISNALTASRTATGAGVRRTTTSNSAAGGSASRWTSDPAATPPCGTRHAATTP